VPENEPYAHGETIRDGIVASLVPRFLMPGKATAGGQQTFTRFTGLNLLPGTSMGASLLGEGYGNFGWLGGTLFLFVYGFALAAIVTGLCVWFSGNPLFLAFLPNIFLQGIKAETDFVTSANFIAKSALLHLILYVLLRKVLSFRAEQRHGHTGRHFRLAARDRSVPNG
jgi:hypothetical protein